MDAAQIVSPGIGFTDLYSILQSLGWLCDESRKDVVREIQENCVGMGDYERFLFFKAKRSRLKGQNPVYRVGIEYGDGAKTLVAAEVWATS